MNTSKGRENFKNLQVMLDSGCRSTIIMGNIMSNIRKNKGVATQWKTRTKNSTTNQKVKVKIFKLEFSAKKVVTWGCDVDNSAECWYN